MIRCSCCFELLDESEFSKNDKYTTKSGEVKYYRSRSCKSCVNSKQRNKGREKKRDTIHKLLSWPAIMLFAFVTGIYQFDSVSGRNRTCTYESIYGHHSVTIPALRTCPLTWEFEV